jgi:hypothetical protein
MLDQHRIFILVVSFYLKLTASGEAVLTPYLPFKE